MPLPFVTDVYWFYKSLVKFYASSEIYHCGGFYGVKLFNTHTQMQAHTTRWKIVIETILKRLKWIKTHWKEFAARCTACIVHVFAHWPLGACCFGWIFASVHNRLYHLMNAKLPEFLLKCLACMQLHNHFLFLFLFFSCFHFNFPLFAVFSVFSFFVCTFLSFTNWKASILKRKRFFFRSDT